MKNENQFQAGLIKDIKALLPGVIVLKNDPNYLAGIPDLTVLYNGKWALLEVKKEQRAPHRPLQDYYIEKAADMSYGFIIYPENKMEVLNELCNALKS